MQVANAYALTYNVSTRGTVTYASSFVLGILNFGACRRSRYLFFFFFKNPPPTEISPLPLHAALPINRVALHHQPLGFASEAQIAPRSGLGSGQALLLGRRRRGDHDHGGMPRHGPGLPQLAAHDDTVQVLEVRVNEDHVRPHVRRVLQQLEPARHGQDPVSLRGEHAVERPGEPRAGVRDECDRYADEGRALRQARAFEMRACVTA